MRNGFISVVNITNIIRQYVDIVSLIYLQTIYVVTTSWVNSAIIIDY